MSVTTKSRTNQFYKMQKINKMTQIIKIIAFIIAGFWAGQLLARPASCTEQITTVYIFIDYTDDYAREQFRLHVDEYYKAIERLFPMESCRWGCGKIHSNHRFGHRDSLNESIMRHCLKGLNRFSPPAEYLLFKKKLRQIFTELAQDGDRKYDHTYVFEPLCNEYQHLLDEPSGRKLMIFFSDLLENSSGGNMYNHVYDPETTIDQWEEKFACNLNDFRGIDIYVLSFRNQNSEEHVLRAKRFWRKVFELRHAKSIKYSSSLHIK